MHFPLQQAGNDACNARPGNSWSSVTVDGSDWKWPPSEDSQAWLRLPCSTLPWWHRDIARCTEKACPNLTALEAVDGDDSRCELQSYIGQTNTSWRYERYAVQPSCSITSLKQRSSLFRNNMFQARGRSQLGPFRDPSNLDMKFPVAITGYSSEW